MSNGLAVIGGDHLARAEATGLDMVRDLEGIFALADALKDAHGFLPSWVKTKGQAVAVLLAGRELGIPPMRAFRVLHSIEGKIELAASEMLALLIRGGVRIEWVKSDGTVAHGRFTRAGYPTHEEVYTIDDARAAGLAGKGNWNKHPKAMLRARCASGAARWWAPDLLGNVYVEGEIVESLGASTGSPEVRALSEALHDDPAPTGAHAAGDDLLRTLDRAMEKLSECVTSADVHEWVNTWAPTVSREPASTAKNARWKEVQRLAAGCTPPVRTEELKRAFGVALAAKAPKPAATPDVIDGIAEDGEQTPLARAYAELASVEGADSAHAWLNDNRAALAGLTAGSPEDMAMWKAIYTQVGDDVAADLERALS